MFSTLALICFGRIRLGHTTKTNFITFQTVQIYNDPEICSILIFHKRVWDYLLHHIFCMTFFKKNFLILYSRNWPNFIFYLPWVFEILDNIFIVIICCPVCDVITLEINLWNFFIKPFFYIIRKSGGQRFKYLKNLKSNNCS